jgi:Sigma-70 region 2
MGRGKQSRNTQRSASIGFGPDSRKERYDEFNCKTERGLAEAIGQAKGGDSAAFEYLYKVHCRRVYALCLRMIKNPAEAEDLTQQAFLQLLQKNRHVPQRVSSFNLAAQSDCEHRIGCIYVGKNRLKF